jgi:glycosyltransferase involved in cell wall biosynthesis
MRVLHVMESTIGGTRRHLVDLASGQRRRGLDVHLAVSNLRQASFESDLARLEAEGCGVLRIPMVREIAPAQDAVHLAALARHLESLRPQIVHTHSSKGGTLGRLASIATGVGARVHTPHTFAFLFDAMFPAWKRELFRDVETALAGHTLRTIAVSASEAATIGRSGVVDPARIRVVPNGPDPAPWIGAQAMSRGDLGLPEDAPVAAVLGLLNVAKGQDLALDMLAREGLERLHLVLAGEGEMREELRAKAETLGVADRVRLLGFRDDAPAIVAMADFTLLPSRWEGMPYIALESMAAGRPVVATPVDGARDLVEHGSTGFLAREISADALAEAVRALLALAPDQRRAMGARGRERMLARWTADRMVEGVLAVYDEVG